MAKKIWDDPINKHVDWGGDDFTTNLPVSGRRVQEFIRESLESKTGCFYYDEVAVKYLVFADEENRDLYLSDRVTYADLLLAQFDAPAPYTIQITTADGSPVEKGILAGSTGVELKFNFKVLDSSGSEVRDSVLVTYTFLNAGVSKTTTKVFSSGETPVLLVDDYLSIGANEITIRVDGRSTGASKTAVYSWTVIQLDLSTSFSIARSIMPTDILQIPYRVAGLGSKTIEFYIDGVKTPNDDVVVDTEQEKTYFISTGFTSGKHSLQIRAYTTFNGSNFLSKTLYREFVVSGVAGKYTTISLDYPPGTVIAADKSNLIISAERYVTISIPWGYYSSDGLSAVVAWRVDGTTITSREVSNITAEVETTPVPVSFMPTEIGTHTLDSVIFSGNQIIQLASYTVQIVENTSGIREATEGMTLKLSALGRTNTEPDAEKPVWSYGNITTTFSNVEWTDLSGWKDDALVLSGSAQATINYKPLAIQSYPAVTYGATVEIEFETFNIEDENAVVGSIYVGGANPHGIQLTATKASITSTGGTVVSTRYKDGERVKIAFIINRNSGIDERCLTYIQNNGILERAGQYALSDSYTTDANIVLGGNANAGIKVYSIRCYSRALTTDEEFYNYIIDSSHVAAKIEENDVYLEGTKTVSLEKMQGRLPVLTFTGPMHLLFASSSKDTQIHCDISFVNPDDPTRNFTIEQGRVKLQGTSSLGYPRKNFKIYMKKDNCVTRDYNGNVITDWQMKTGAVPCHTFTLKADFSDSSCTHNSTIARMYGDLEPSTVVNGSRVLRTPPQVVADTTYPATVGKPFPYQLRTTPDSFPMVCFYREEYGDSWIFMGQYNFLNDKGNDFLYGFRSIYDKEDPWDDTGTRLWDNQYTHCFEVLNNTDSTGLCEWKDSTQFFQTNPETGHSYWEDTFESRYPEPEGTESKEEMDALAQSLYNFHSWLASCWQVDQGGSGSMAKFNSEYELHIDKYFFASYYSYLMRFGAVDQVNKNMMITTYDGVHWLPIRYDNDTILGQRNDTRLIYDYTITRQSVDPETGDYAYAGHSSWLWNALEASTTFMATVSEVDSALYTAGLHYSATVNYFDVTQSDKWCERIYNDNGRYKYIEPLIYDDKNYLEALQGKRQSHRHWWLRNRFDLFDAYFLSGEYTDKAVRVTIPGAPINTAFSIKAGKQNYYGWGFAKTPQETGILKQKGESYTFHLPRQAAVGDPVYIYAATSLEELDLSNFCKYFSNAIDISGCYDETIGTKLKVLKLGNPAATEVNTAQLTFGGFANMSRLESLDIQNFAATTNFSLTGMTSLKNFYALGSGLTSFTCPSGLNFINLQLPQSVRSFVLEQVSWTNLTFTPTNSLTYVEFTKMKGQNVKTFIDTWVAAIEAAGAVSGLDEFADKTLKLSIPKSDPWTGVTVQFMLNLARFGTKDIRGRYVLGQVTQEQVVALTNAFGPNVWNVNSAFVIDASAGLIMNYNNSHLFAGESDQFTAVSFPISETGHVIRYSIQGVSPSQDQQGNTIYIKGNATLDGLMGTLTTVEDATADNTFTVVGRDMTTAETATASYTVYKRTYPTAVAVASSEARITSTGLYVFSATYTPAVYNGSVNAFTWTISTAGSVVAAIDSQELDKCYVRVTSLSTTATDSITVNLSVTYKDTTTITGSATVQASLPFVIGDYGYNPDFVAVCWSKGIAAAPDNVTNLDARAWVGENELTIADTESATVTSFDGAYDWTRWYKYFVNCTKLIINCPALTGTLDLHDCPNYTSLNISGCYVGRTVLNPINVILGPNLTSANVGNSPSIQAAASNIFTAGEDALTFNVNALTSIELDNCPFE